MSLGSYEAGLSWAVVRYSRDASARPSGGGESPHLVTLTGASAGSINALLSAVLWCAEPAPDEDSVDHNLLHDLWAEVGFDGLLPEKPAGYLPGDALLSSRPLLDGVTRFERSVGSGAGARRFRPGCLLPVGLTVTRATAAEHEVGGLALRVQRFALPWRFEVGADGRPRVTSQRLGDPDAQPDVLDIARREREAGATVTWPQVTQGILASAAFPLAFPSRELCDCAARCPLANQVKTGTCQGPLGPMTQLSCPARSAEGEPLTLCSHQYVDGGIFDNTPVGLGVELAQSLAATQPLQPVTYVYIDPDLRRLRPVTQEHAGAAARSSSPARGLGQNLEAAARLAAELVATARSENLSRTLRSGQWNVTTRGLLYETAASLVSFANVQHDAAVAMGKSAPRAEVRLGGDAPSAVGGALARALIRCFPGRSPGDEAVQRCARELAEVTAAQVGRDPEPASEEEIIAVADAMRRAAQDVLRSHSARAAHDADVFAREMRIAAVGMTFLANEMTRVARGDLEEPRLKQFRAALLETIQLGRALGVEVAHVANGAALDELDALATDPVAGAAAARASATIRASPDTLFLADDLQPVLNALAADPAGSRASRALREIVRVGPALQGEIVRAYRLARAADALEQTRTERALVLSSRFAPIAGSQLGNFGAFLDRPFREYDYDAGVYDASHAIAVALCDAGAVPGAPRPARDVRASNALDLRALETQRCVGIALETVVRELDVDRSATAGHVVRRLARAELEASLGEAPAQQLLAERAWAWVAAPPAAEPDAAVTIVADALLSSRVACSADAPSPCIRELTFEELLTALRARQYRPESREMRALLDDPDAWTWRTLRRLVDRSYERELARPGTSELAPAILVAHRVSELWLRAPSSFGPFPAFLLDPSSIPAGGQTTDARRLMAHLVPYRLDLDVARGGVAASWIDPELWLGPRASVAAEITPISYEAAHGRTTASLAVVPKLHVAGLSIGAGPKGSVRWTDGTTKLGALLRVAAFQQRLSFSVGTDAVTGHNRDVFFTIGVADLNGALFWLLGSPGGARREGTR